MRKALWAAIVLSTALRAGPESAPINAPMPVTVWVDRTAVYPGDRFHYVARVEHSPGIEFVREHVRKDQLSLQPFDVLDIATSEGDLPGGRKYFEVKLTLDTYDFGHADATIPSFNLFYFERSQAASKDTAPAETLAVPPLKIGLRSTLADLPGVIRDNEPPLPLSQTDWLFPAALGWCGLLGVIAYGSSLGVKAFRAGFWKQKTDERIREKSVRESFDELRQSPIESDEQLAAFYTKASAMLRGLASEQAGDCGGLTPAEVQTALRQSNQREDRATALRQLLEECDLVRYSSDGARQARGRSSAFLEKFAELIERR